MVAADAMPATDATVILDGATPIDAAAQDVGFVDAGNASDAEVSDASVTQDGGTGPCTVDTDCADGWCRPTMTGGTECVPWAQEGERCGGFVAPWDRERCSPANTCFPVNPLVPDLPGVCALEATVSELQREPATYAGRVVGVLEGYVINDTAACTRIGCPPSDPCCNTCMSNPFFADTQGAMAGLSLLFPGGQRYACSGDECMPYAQCDLVAGRYRILGTYQARPAPGIIVESANVIP